MTKRADVWLFGILGLALAVRIVYLVMYSQSPFWDQLTVDNWYHVNWARTIADGNILGDTTYFRAPFYVYCLAILQTLLGDSLWAPRLFGLAIGLASVAMSYIIGRRLYGRTAGRVAALLHALLPIAIYYESEILLDPLFTLLVQVLLLRAVIWLGDGSSRNMFWLGLVCGLAAITRPTILVAVPLILVCAVVLFGWRDTVRKGCWLLVGLCIFIGPVAARNLIVAGDPVLIASQGGVNLYIGNNDDADGFSAKLPEPLGTNWQMRQVTFIAERESGQSLKPGQVSAFWTRKAVDWVFAHPVRFVGLFFTRAYYQLLNRDVSNDRALGPFFAQFVILKYNPLTFGVILPLAVLGIMSLRPFDRKTVFLLAFLGAYIVAVSLFFYNSRFRLPLLPVWLVFAGCGVSVALRTLASTTKRQLILSAILLGAVAIVSFVPLVSPPTGISTGHLTSRGLYYYAKGSTVDALRGFREAARLDPTAPEVNLNIGACLLRMGMADSARVYFDRELQMHPGRPKVYQNLASLLLAAEEYVKARERIAQALAIAPYDATANQIALRAVAFDTMTSIDSLIRAADNTAKASAYDPEVIDEAAAFLIAHGRLEAAQRLLVAGLAASPPPIETDDLAFSPAFPHGKASVLKAKARLYHQLGYVAGLEGRYDEAIAQCRMAIEGDSLLADAYVNLALGYLSLGRSTAADSVLAEAARRFPDHQRIRELRRRLSQ